MHSPKNARRFQVNHLAVGYTDMGPCEAPVVLLIHGFPLNRFMWQAQVNALQANYRVVAYDVRGHGTSELGTDPLSIDLLAQDLIDFMDALNLEKVTLCGLSMGGYIAMNAVGRWPERFSALVLCDTQCVADTEAAKAKRMAAIESIQADGVEQYAEASLEHLFAPLSVFTNPKAIDAVERMIVDTPAPAIIATLHALANRNSACETLGSIELPTLIMVGAEDRITPVAAAQQMHDAIPGSKQRVIPHAAHLSNMENPDAFNLALLDFLVDVHGLSAELSPMEDSASDEDLPYELPEHDKWSEEQLAAYSHIEADLNAKILTITLSIKTNYPELIGFIEEMPVTVPIKSNPAITLNNLRAYYESLNMLLLKHMETHGKVAGE